MWARPTSFSGMVSKGAQIRGSVRTVMGRPASTICHDGHWTRTRSYPRWLSRVQSAMYEFGGPTPERTAVVTWQVPAGAHISSLFHHEQKHHEQTCVICDILLQRLKHARTLSPFTTAPSFHFSPTELWNSNSSPHRPIPNGLPLHV